MFSKRQAKDTGDIETSGIPTLRKGSVLLDWEKDCEDVFYLIQHLVNGNIANIDLTAPLPDTLETWEEAESAYNQQFHTWHAKETHPKILAAKYWLLTLVCLSLFLREYFVKDSPNYLIPFIFTFLLGTATKLYQNLLGTLPLQSIGGLLLNKEERKNYEIQKRFDIAYVQAERASPLNPLRFFSWNSPLDKALRSRDIPVLEHQALMRGLFSLKNNSFDCVGISSLVILTLIEKKIPLTIERINTYESSGWGHHYIVVNRDQDCLLRDTHSWNDNAILIDPWYGLCIFAKQIKDDPTFLLKYPLLNPFNKIASTLIQGNTPSSGYQIYVKLFQQLRDQHENQPQEEASCLDVIYPRLAGG